MRIAFPFKARSHLAISYTGLSSVERNNSPLYVFPTMVKEMLNVRHLGRVPAYMKRKSQKV